MAFDLIRRVQTLGQPRLLVVGDLILDRYIWGDADATVGRVAAQGTGEFVSAAYAMEVLPGVGHFVMDQAAGRSTELLLAHLKRHPA